MARPETDREVIDLDTEPIGPQALARVDPRDVLVQFEANAELMKRLVPASIRATKPQDWIRMGGKVYLQGTGVERIAALWGLRFYEPTVTREDFPDGEFAYVCRGAIECRLTGVSYQSIEGGRSSRDPFFDSFDQDKPENWNSMGNGEREEWRARHRLPVDPMEVRKAAVTNWQTRGASMLTGMRGLTQADLDACGVKDVKSVEYGAGKKGGSTAPADLKAQQTALWNDCLRRTGGEVALAKELLKDVTAYPAGKNKTTGQDYAAFSGADAVEKITRPQSIAIALEKLKKHPTFGDDAAARQPGEEG